MGFFDKASNRVGAVCARLSGDAAEVQAATGLRLGLVLQGVSSMLIGVVMAFCYGWKLTLVGLAILPVVSPLCAHQTRRQLLEHPERDTTIIDFASFFLEEEIILLMKTKPY